MKGRRILSKQFLRSTTSIGANIEVAIGGRSDADFFAKNINRIQGSERKEILDQIKMKSKKIKRNLAFVIDYSLTGTIIKPNLLGAGNPLFLK